MSAHDESQTIRTLEQAERLIDEQAQEINRLRALQARESFARELGDALLLANSAGVIASASTHTDLLELILRTAMQVIDAQAGSLLLIDQATQELVFEVTLGDKAGPLLGMRVPLGHGIVGLVAVTGQPMIVRNTDDENRTAREFAERIGYKPQTLLCVPLFYSDTVIGVMEILDKRNGVSFAQADVIALGLFANQAAITIQQSHTHHNLPALVGELLNSLSQMPDYQKQGLEQRVREFTSVLEGDPAYQRALDLARLVNEVTWQGQNEAETCHMLLKGFADYLRKRQAGQGGGQ